MTNFFDSHRPQSMRDEEYMRCNQSGNCKIPRCPSDTSCTVISDSIIPIQAPTCSRCRLKLQNYNSSASPHGHSRMSHNRHRRSVREHDFHCHKSREPSDTLAVKQLICAGILCFLFMAGEFVGGIISNSLALITDATHLVSDLMGFAISVFAIHLAKKTPTVRFSFGFLRADVMGAVVSIMIIWVLVAILAFLAIQRIINRQFELHSTQMLVVAGFGIVINVIIGIVLHSEICLKVSQRFGHSHGGHGHSHGGHGHSHYNSKQQQQQRQQLQHNNNGRTNNARSPLLVTERAVNLESKHSAARLKMEKNINVRAAFIHVIGDLLQSIGVFISALVIHINPRFKLADPVCTLVFSIITLFTTFSILMEVLHVILEDIHSSSFYLRNSLEQVLGFVFGRYQRRGVPKDIDYRSLRAELGSIEGVAHVHSLHVWSLTIDKVAVSVHLAIVEEAYYHRVLDEAYKLLQYDYDYYSVCVQVEPYHPMMHECDKCTAPE